MIPWNTWSKSGVATLICLSLPSLAGGQDLEEYFNLAYQGQRGEVAAALPDLYRQHPNNGSVLFLEALITEDGEVAVEMYKRVASLYPTSPHAADALLKVGEYLYSRGLYGQASQYLKRIPVHYPRSELVYPGIRLYLNALLVSGARDSALFYAQVFSPKFPKVEFDLEAGKTAGLPSQGAETGGGPPAAGTPAKVAEQPTRNEASTRTAQPVKRFRLQVGAFSILKNAERQQELLESLNYRVSILTRDQRGRSLHLVMVEGFASRDDARLAGKLLKDNYGIDYLVLSNE